MKKLLCMILALAMLPVAAVPAFAVVNGIFLGSDENGVNILNDKLRPGEDYYFPVLVAVDGTPPTQLTAADLDRNKLEVRIASGGKALASATVEERGGLAYICVTPGSLGTVQELTSTLRINYRSRDTKENVTVTPTLKTGYLPMPDSTVEALEPGAFLEMDNTTPILTPAHLNRLAKLNEYRDVTLYGNGWRFTVNTTSLGKRNLVTDHGAVMDLVKKFPDHQMHFIGFPGAPDFEVTGRLALDVSDLADEYGGDFFLYRCAYGKLYPLKYEYDKDAMEISIRASQLSTYLITDRSISLSDHTPTQPDSSSDSPPLQPNPSTGGAAYPLPALLTATLSLIGLGALTLRRKK